MCRYSGLKEVKHSCPPCGLCVCSRGHSSREGRKSHSTVQPPGGHATDFPPKVGSHVDSTALDKTWAGTSFLWSSSQNPEPVMNHKKTIRQTQIEDTWAILPLTATVIKQAWDTVMTQQRPGSHDHWAPHGAPDGSWETRAAGKTNETWVKREVWLQRIKLGRYLWQNVSQWRWRSATGETGRGLVQDLCYYW